MDIIQGLREALSHVQGFIYPNELELQWSVLIVIYPYITGLVAGAFILASLVKVFNVAAVKDTYRLALLTALSFLIVAPLPLLLHLGHYFRGIEIMLTPNPTSAMAMFGFVYIWYLMAVLLIELWLEYRVEIVGLAKTAPAWKRWIYALCTLGVRDLPPAAVALDERIARAVSVIGIPSAVFLHGYVGFIFGSIKANPWWSTPLMPIIFLFSAVVSGIALVLLIYTVACRWRGVRTDIACLDTIATFLLSALVLAFSLESLEMIQKTYEMEENFEIMSLLVQGKLFFSLIFVQIFMGAVVPLATLGLTKIVTLRPAVRKSIYVIDSVLILIGVFAMRWNVVIGGQFISKSFQGFTTYKLELIGKEGVLTALAVMVLPFLVLAVMAYLFNPWPASGAGGRGRSREDAG